MDKLKAPGITLKLKSIKKVSTFTGKRKAIVELDAEILDEELWEDVQKELNKGVTIYSAKEFDGEILKILREELDVLENKNLELTRKLMTQDLILQAYKEGILPDKNT